jgi:hypothetical protein
VAAQHPLLVRGDVEQAKGRDPLRLSLQLEGLDLLDLDRFSHESVRRRADQDLERRRGLLEPCRDVHRVAGDQSLPRRRVAGDDLARVDSGSVGEADAPDALQLVVESGKGELHLVRRTYRAQRVVLLDARQAEDRHDRIADVLLDGAAVPLQDHPHLVEVARHDLA